MYDKSTFWKPSDTYFHSSADDEHFMNFSTNSSIILWHNTCLDADDCGTSNANTKGERLICFPVVVDDIEMASLKPGKIASRSCVSFFNTMSHSAKKILKVILVQT